MICTNSPRSVQQEYNYKSICIRYLWHYLVVVAVILLPNDKILDLFKLKAFAYDRIHVTKKLKFDVGQTEKNEGKEGNPIKSIFSLSHNVF